MGTKTSVIATIGSTIVSAFFASSNTLARTDSFPSFSVVAFDLRGTKPAYTKTFESIPIITTLAPEGTSPDRSLHPRR